MSVELAALAAIVVLAYAVQTATGFGAVVVSVTVGAHLMEIPELLLLLLPLSLLQTSYVAGRYRRDIDWRLLCRWIIPVMGAGTAAGAALAGQLGGDLLRRLLASLIMVLSIFELVALSRRDLAARPLGPVGTVVGLIGAGLMHGIYGTGGPLLTYTIGRRGLGKAAFRATVTLVWIFLNVGLVSYFLIDGRYRPGHVLELALLVPAVAAGTIAGELVFARLGGRRFNQIVFGLLAAAAFTLLVR